MNILEIEEYIQANWHGWHYDAEPCIFQTKNEGEITWLQWSRYRLRITDREIRIYYGNAAKKPIHIFPLELGWDDINFNKIMNNISDKKDKGISSE